MTLLLQKCQCKLCKCSEITTHKAIVCQFCKMNLHYKDDLIKQTDGYKNRLEAIRFTLHQLVRRSRTEEISFRDLMSEFGKAQGYAFLVYTIVEPQDKSIVKSSTNSQPSSEAQKT